MGFGSFLGGMGQAAEGMQDAAMATKTMRAKDLYNDAMAGQVREQNFQEQNRRAQLDALRNMQAANFGTAPDPTVGATGTFKPAAQKAPMGDAPAAGTWETPVPAPQGSSSTSTFQTGNLGRNAPGYKSPKQPDQFDLVTWDAGHPSVAPQDHRITSWSQLSDLQKQNALRISRTPTAVTPTAPASRNATPADFPRVSGQEQAARDASRLAILEAELKDNPNDPALQAEIARAQGYRNNYGARPATAQAPTATQQVAQAPAQPTTYDTTQSPGVSGQNPNIAQQMWQSQVQLQQIRLRNARTPEEAMDAHGQMLKLHLSKYNSDLEKIARSASMGDSGAMNHLVGQLSGTFFNGQPLHVVQSGGGYVLTSAQGQPVSGKPTDIGTLSSWMLQNLSQSRQELAMQQQALYAQNYYGEKGKVDAQTPLKLAEIAANHAYDGQKIDMQTAADIKKEIAKHGLESGDIRGVSQNPTGDGWLVYPKSGAPFIVTPGKTINNVVTDPQTTRVPGMYGGMPIAGDVPKRPG